MTRKRSLLSIGYAQLDEHDYEVFDQLVEGYAAAADWTKVKSLGEMALFVNPADPDLHAALGQAYLALGQIDDAVYEYQSALLTDPPLARPAIAHLGLARAYLARKHKAAARAAIAEALRVEPGSAEALALKKKL